MADPQQFTLTSQGSSHIPAKVMENLDYANDEIVSLELQTQPRDTYLNNPCRAIKWLVYVPV